MTRRRPSFNTLVAGCIALAYAHPPLGRKGGPLRPEWTVKYAVVALIFLLSGLALRAKQLRAAALNVRAHAVTQAFSFVAVPAATSAACAAVAWAAPSLLAEELRTGLLAVACLPPPVSSAVILARASGANEAVAIFNSTLGSLAGVFVSPLLLLAAVGAGEGAGGVPVGTVLAKMGGTVLLPLVLGQALQARLGARRVAVWAARYRFSDVSSGALLLIIYCVFCDTFGREADLGVAARDVAACALFVLVVHLALLAAATAAAGAAGLPRGDVVAVGFAATHKSLTLGLPLMQIVFEGDARLVLLTLPLLLQHPAQIVAGGSMAGEFKRWIAAAGSGGEAVEMV